MIINHGDVIAVKNGRQYKEYVRVDPPGKWIRILVNNNYPLGYTVLEVFDNLPAGKRTKVYSSE